MRNTFREEHFTFTNPSLQGWGHGQPDRIIVHRQGNPGAHARDALAWGNREGTFTIHTYIEDDLVFHCVPLNRHAFHAASGSAAQAKAWGYPHLTPGGSPRGDIRAVGIETVDVPGGGPGQAYSLSQETRITLVLVLARQCLELGLDPLNGHTIEEHAGYDPVTRSEDLGDALHIPDLRLDVADFMAGRTPWRTVQQFAFGRPAPESWNTGDRPPPPPPPPPAPTVGRETRIEPMGAGQTTVEWGDKDDERLIVTRQKVRLVKDV